MTSMRPGKPLPPSPTTRLCLACREQVALEDLATGHLDHTEGTWSYALLRCPVCGVGRLEPSPPEAALRVMYGPDFHAYRDPTRTTLHGLKRAAKMALARVASTRCGATSPLLRAVARAWTTAAE